MAITAPTPQTTAVDLSVAAERAMNLLAAALHTSPSGDVAEVAKRLQSIVEAAAGSLVGLSFNEDVALSGAAKAVAYALQPGCEAFDDLQQAIEELRISRLRA